MARLFDDASNEYLNNPSPVISGYPATLAAWFQTDDIAKTNQTILSVCQNGATGSNIDFFLLHIASEVAGDPIRALNREVGTNAIATTSTGVSVNTWHHGCAVFTSPTSRAAFIDGGSKGTNADNVAPEGLTETFIGRTVDLAPANDISGIVAEAAIWNMALTDGEVAILAAGYSPLFVHPQNLVAYWPLVRGLNNKVGGFNMTATGTVVSAHPRVIYPSKIWTPSGEAVAPPVGMAGAMTTNTGFWGY